MGRRPRIHFSGAVYHVTNRGVDRRDIFRDDHDRLSFLEMLRRICAQASAEILAYCLMDNHFHLAIQVGAIPLSTIMHRLETGYCTAFNARHSRSGHLLESRYRSRVCLDDAYLLNLIRYIHQNPVRAGIVATAAGWPWSSFMANGTGDAPVEAGFELWPKVKETVSLSRFVDIPQLALEELAVRVQRQSGITLKEMCSADRRRQVVAARRTLTQLAIRNGHALCSIARWLGTTATSVTRYSKENTVTNVRPGT
jgi:REP element-mobilizing transposase RayT